jgi:hypothetical protein
MGDPSRRAAFSSPFVSSVVEKRHADLSLGFSTSLETNGGGVA